MLNLRSLDQRGTLVTGPLPPDVFREKVHRRVYGKIWVHRLQNLTLTTISQRLGQPLESTTKVKRSTQVATREGECGNIGRVRIRKEYKKQKNHSLLKGCKALFGSIGLVVKAKCHNLV